MGADSFECAQADDLGLVLSRTILFQPVSSFILYLPIITIFTVVQIEVALMVII